MKLKKLLDYAGIPYYGKNPEITDITEDSRTVTSGSLFFAVTGFSTDGNRFIPDAVRKGAVAVISDNREKAREYSKKYEVPVIYVENIREKEALIASKFFGEPSKKLKIFGITGTNGKTTTSYILYTVLNRLGRKTAITGTVEYGTPENRKPASRTTPSAIEYNRILKEFLDEG
ncbi:MAG: UDP-N-acetylmuramoyl-L-alanyl-D-glutamate--2,6-diaminopimelate ligase, partial [Desulfurobacterium sp.]